MSETTIDTNEIYARKDAVELAIRSGATGDAILLLAGSIHAYIQGVEAPNAGEAEKPKRGRPAKATTDIPAAASGQSSSGDTESPAPGAMSGADTDAQRSNAPIVDAGTGKPVEPAAEVDWPAIKGRAAKLTTLANGADALQALLRDFCPEGAVIKMGSVPETRQAEFGVAVEAKIASLEALSD